MLVLTEPSVSGRSVGRRSTEHRAERLDLDRVAERRAGAVRFDVADLRRVDARVRRAPRGSTASCARPFGAVRPLLRAVLVDGGAADDRQDAVAVGLRRPTAA